MVQNGDKMFVRILGLSPMDPLVRKPILAREEKIVDTAEGKLQGVEKEVEISCCFHLFHLSQSYSGPWSCVRT